MKGLFCRSKGGARKQITYLTSRYFLTNQVQVSKPIRHEGLMECWVYVWLTDEDMKLDYYDYLGSFGFWKAYAGRVTKDGKPASKYVFVWKEE